MFKSVLIVYNPKVKRPKTFKDVLYQYLDYWFFINGSITPITYTKSCKNFAGLWLPQGQLIFPESKSETCQFLKDYCVINYMSFKHSISMLKDKVEDCIILDKNIKNFHPFTADRFYYFPEYEVEYD